MKFKIAILFISILLLQKEVYADGCNTGAFTIINNCNNLLNVCFTAGSTSDEPSHTDYTWDFGDGQTGFYQNSAQTICNTYSVPGTYTVTLTVFVVPQNKTCVITRQITVTASPVLTITNPAPVCQPTTVDLTDAAITAGSTGLATITYWTNAGGTSPLSSPSAVSTSGTYYIKNTVTAPSGILCSDIQPVIVVVHPKPVLSITNPPAICAPGPVDITLASVTAGSTGGGTLSYWTDPAATNPLVAPNAVTNSATYYIKTVTTDGCIDINPVTVTIYPLPISNAGSDITICSGSVGSIGTTTSAINSYSWLPTAGLSSATISDPTITTVNNGTVPVVTTYTVTTTITATGCNTSDVVVVNTNPPATVDAGPAQTICSDGSATLTGIIGGAATSAFWGGGNGTYAPNNNALNAVYTPHVSESLAGSVTLTLVSNDPVGPCPVASSTIIITINPIAIVTAGLDQTICIGSTVTLAGVPSGAASSGTWTGGNGTYNPSNTDNNAVYTPSAFEAAAGTVLLTFTTNDPSGPCSAVSDNMSVTINHLPTADAGPSQTVCPGLNFTLAGTIGGTGTFGTWSGGTGTFDPSNTVLNAVYNPGAADYAADSVKLTLTSDDPPGPCSSVSSDITLYFYKDPVVNFSVDDSSGCPIHCVNLTDLTTVGGGDQIVAWKWNFGDNGPDSTTQNHIHCYPRTGFYDVTLIAVSNHDCADTLTLPHLIQVFPVPLAAFNPTPNPATVIQPVVIMVNQSSPDVNYWHWDFGDGNTMAPDSVSPEHNYPSNKPGSYLVTLIVHNAYGCYDTAMHEVVVAPEFAFYIPNAFTPNDDGINDVFFGQGIGIEKYELMIFDRWGNLIFYADELNKVWDGKANHGSDMAQQDVYIWKVKLTDVFRKQHNYVGTVTIVK